MKHFCNLTDLGNLHLDEIIEEALQIKKSPLSNKNLGKDKRLCLYFLNPSLRTRLSTQVAALNLGIDPLILDATQGWNIEYRKGVTMNTSSAEHIAEMVQVISQYADIISLRSFPTLEDRTFDYNETILNSFREYSDKPIISLESATGHPLQSLTDMITIKEFFPKRKPKVVLTWAPHPKKLPQAVANTFSQFALSAGHHLTITHPKGFELKEEFTSGAQIVYDQKEALKDADIVYVKNWSAYTDYGKTTTQHQDWIIDQAKLSTTNNAKVMHCLPVRRNVVIADNVLDSKNSIVIQQAANRIWAAQVVLKKILLNLI